MGFDRRSSAARQSSPMSKTRGFAALGFPRCAFIEALLLVFQIDGNEQIRYIPSVPTFGSPAVLGPSLDAEEARTRSFVCSAFRLAYPSRGS